MDAVARDFRGSILAVGDEVAFDTMAYRSSALRVGVITEVHGRMLRVRYPVNGSLRSISRMGSGVVKVAPVGI